MMDEDDDEHEDTEDHEMPMGMGMWIRTRWGILVSLVVNCLGYVMIGACGMHGRSMAFVVWTLTHVHA